jgi:hypothetical protein
MSDPIEDAIRATEPQGEIVQMQQINVTLGSTGRPVVLAIPSDISVDEILDLATWLTFAGGLRSHLAPKPSPLVVARGIPIIGRPQ